MRAIGLDDNRSVRIRAAVLEQFGAPLAVQEIDLAEPQAGEVLVRLVACGVCHTDLYTASGADPSGYAPTVLGHEGAGVVEAVGDGVASVSPGDHVVTLFSPQCRECEHCLDPRTNLCLAIREQKGLGFLPDGTATLSRQGAERIGCVERTEGRHELARGRGGTDTLQGGPDDVEQIVGMTGGFGADYTFEATGNGQVMRQAVESARMGWGLATVCGVAGKGETLDIVPRFLITGRRVAGSSFGGVKGRDQVPQFVDRYLAGEIDVDPFVSHRLTLDDVNRGFELMEAQDGIRSVIAFA